MLLPTLKYGYRTEPIDWPELIQIINFERDFDKLTRNEDQQREYMIFMHKLKEEWRSVVDFMLCTKFGLESRTDEKTALLFSYPPLSEITDVRKRLVKNDFPYYFAKNVEHWILWKLGGNCSEADISEAEKELKEVLGDVKDFLHWNNPPRLRSLPEVDHVHILIYRDPLR